MRRTLTLIAATAFLIAVAPPSYANTVLMGPQAMEGNLIVSPGTIIKAGISFTIPGSHPATTVQFADPLITFKNIVCTSTGTSSGRDFGHALGSGSLLGPYSVPANDTAWIPTGDQASDASYQASFPAPDLCQGGNMSLRNGAAFSADLQSDQTNKISIRYHYSANGSSGSWSATTAFDPDSISGSPVPQGAAGVIVLSILIAIAALIATRRQRRDAQITVG